MATRARYIFLLACCWFCSLPVSAQDISAEPAADKPKPEEEITVIGQKELSSLKMDIMRAEDLKFEIFNSLNSTDDFDITCDMIAPINSHIKRRYCNVGFIKKAQAEDMRILLDSAYRMLGASGLPPTTPIAQFLDPGLIRSNQRLAGEFADKFKAMDREMLDLAVKHPELASALIREHELKQRYQAERRERYQDSILIGHPEPDENVVVLNELDMLYMSFLDYKNGAMPDEIWERWDSWYKTLFRKETYQTMWAGANRENYTEEFIEYVNAISSEL